PWTELDQWIGRAGGLLKWSSRASVENVGAVLKEGEALLQAVGSTGPTPAEVEVLRRVMQTYPLRDLQTPAQSVQLYAELIGRGQSEEELAAEESRMVGLTVDAVRAAAARYFDHARMRVVVVGDLAALRAPLGALGWGPIELRDVNGAMVSPSGHAATGG
ncbi:MAG: hypothetical protein ACRENE_01995, partial [Polyangiaceae bacterium]